MNHLPAWSDTASALRGEDRTPAVRALILYPMNALVEDQISRLRSALDSDQARAVLRRILEVIGFDSADLTALRRLQVIRFNLMRMETYVPIHPNARVA